MPYTLRFSDATKTDTITVPDMPPGINTVDTSLNLVGKAYPAYGEKIAENFLHLLENFSGPVPPENPIEGQLWYDTSDARRKILRVMDGTATATRWPSVSGIYQQGTDPKLAASAGLKNGDIWVDTAHNQLKIYNSNSWTLVGPATGSGTSKTGSEPTDLIDSVPPNGTRRVILNWSDGYVVSVISSGPEFTPQTYPTGMEGFTSIKPGVTLSTRAVSGTFAQLLGTADNANKLGGSAAANYLLKTDNTNVGQQITGKVVFVTPTTAGPEGRDGVVIRVDGNPVSEYIQFYKEGNDAIIFNNKDGGKVQIKVRGVSTARVSVEKNLVTVNTSATVAGNLIVANTMTAANLAVSNNVNVANDLKVTSNALVSGITTATGTVYLGSASGSGTAIVPNNTSTYDIGTASKPFRSLYVENLYASSYDSMPGSLRLFAGSTVTNTVPDGWMFCTGTSLTTSSYVDLFDVIGYHYGGSGANFNIPTLFVTQGGATTYYIIRT